MNSKRMANYTIHTLPRVCNKFAWVGESLCLRNNECLMRQGLLMPTYELQVKPVLAFAENFNNVHE